MRSGSCVGHCHLPTPRFTHETRVSNAARAGTAVAPRGESGHHEKESVVHGRKRGYPTQNGGACWRRRHNGELPGPCRRVPNFASERRVLFEGPGLQAVSTHALPLRDAHLLQFESRPMARSIVDFLLPPTAAPSAAQFMF